LPDIDRGTSGIAFLLGVALFTIVPTLVEIGLVLVVMLRRYPGGYAVIIVATFLVYMGFTLVYMARRVIYQRRGHACGPVAAQGHLCAAVAVAAAPGPGPGARPRAARGAVMGRRA